MLTRLLSWTGLKTTSARKSNRPRTRLGCESLETRDVPAVVVYSVDWLNIDTPDANPNDGAPLDANGKVSLRSVIDHVNANGNAAD